MGEVSEIDHIREKYAGMKCMPDDAIDYWYD